MNILRAFSHRPFALLWTGQTTSRLGDNLYRIALAWWVLEKTGSATAMGTVLIFSQVPLLIFILIGGIVVDRFPRIRIMFLSDILSGTVVILIALFSWLDVLQIWHIYIASLLFGFVEAFFFPAYQAVIPQIVPPDMLTSANSLNGLSQRIMGVIGPIVGASLVAVGGTSLTFGLDALSFFASAFCVFPILRAGLYEMPKKEDSAATEIKPRRTIKEEIKRGIADLREGWNAIITIPWIWITILIFGVLNIMEGSPRAVAMPFLIKDELGADVAVLGWFGSAFSVGYVVCALWLGQYKRLRRRGLLGYLPIMVNGIMLLLFGLKSPIPVLIAAMFVYGFCFNIFGLVWNSTLQEMIPHEKLGRVYAIDSLGSWILLPIGFALAGWGTDKLGSPTVFLIGGVGTILMILIGLSHPAIRNLD
ncbi:MAG: MFS transporter [Anaerolineales bacterium]|nr:MFS transporter [Anaerolineales bacterium]MBP8047990.1 MFS transporter [Anaerolineales bacterium]